MSSSGINNQEQPLYLMPEDFISSYRTEVFAIIVDVRTPEEYRKSRIKGAVNVQRMAVLKVFADSLDREIPLYIYCEEESRSLTVANYLISNEFHNINILRGGIIQWESSDMPLDKKRIPKKQSSLVKGKGKGGALSGNGTKLYGLIMGFKNMLYNGKPKAGAARIS